MSSNLPLNVSFYCEKKSSMYLINPSVCVCLFFIHLSNLEIGRCTHYTLQKKCCLILSCFGWGSEVMMSRFTQFLQLTCIIMSSSKTNVCLWWWRQCLATTEMCFVDWLPSKREREKAPLNLTSSTPCQSLGSPTIHLPSSEQIRWTVFSDGQRTDTHTEIPLINSEPQRIGYHINQLLLDLYRLSNSSQLTDCI